MMALLIYDGYAPPVSPTGYDVTESDVLASEQMTESGYTFLERARAKVHKIAVSYTNLTDEELAKICEKLDLLEIPLQFFFGTMKEGNFRVAGDKSVKMKAKFGEGGRWDLSFNLEEY